MVSRGGRLYLLASHEDCEGRRRLVLLALEGDAAGGTLVQGASSVLRVHRGGDGDGGVGAALELAEKEKNWIPFVDRGELHLSYSVQPHAVLRCGW